MDGKPETWIINPKFERQFFKKENCIEMSLKNNSILLNIMERRYVEHDFCINW